MSLPAPPGVCKVRSLGSSAMNTAQLGHRREGPGGYSALCSQLPAFCSWSVRLATKTRPGVQTCCLWDLGFLIRKSPGGALEGMCPLWGYGGFSQDGLHMQMPRPRPRPFPRRAPITGSRWACVGGTLVSPPRGCSCALTGQTCSARVLIPSPGRTHGTLSGLSSRQALLPVCLPVGFGL